jgi:hypothetical protein
MKLVNALFLLVSLHIAVQSTSQESYQPLLEDGRKYHLLQTICDAAGNLLVEVNGDTLLNELEYKKAYALFCGEAPDLLGFLRSNESNSKLWFTDGGGHEILLMDLDLEIGDVVVPDPMAYYPHAEIEVIDIVITEGRKEIIFDTYNGECLIGPNSGLIRFIEGIGPTYSIIPITGLYHYRNMLFHCAAIEDSIVYSNPNTEIYTSLDGCADMDCLFHPTVGVSNSAATKISFKIQHSLYAETLSIHTDARSANYKLFSTTGKIVKSGLLNTGDNGIDVSHLPRGLYVVHCTAGEVRYSEKVMLSR